VGRVPADERHRELAGRGKKTLGEALQPCRVSFPQCQRERHPARATGHRGNIGEVDGHGAKAYVFGRQVRRIVDALDQRVDDRDEIAAGRRPQYRAVVADADTDVGIRRRAREVAANQLELIHRRTFPLTLSWRPARAASSRRDRVRH
jgi:hypothetical protein